MSLWFRWWLVACSALTHYLNQLKDRWFETSWRPCCITNNNATKRDFGITNDYIPKWESVVVCFVINRDMLLNKQSSDWWLETSWRSCGVTVIKTPFRYHSYVYIYMYIVFSFLWNSNWFTIMLSIVYNYACHLPSGHWWKPRASCVYTNCEKRWSQGPHNGACGIRIRVLFEMLSLLRLF